MGLPAQSGGLHIINRFKAGDPRNDIPPLGVAGNYQVTFVLGRPGYSLLPEGQFSFVGGLQGDSHLAITRPAFTPPNDPDADHIRVYGRTEDGDFTFEGYPNERGFLGKLQSFPFAANDRNDAERKAYRALAGSLSNWSIHLDIPLEICQVETVELATGNVQMSLTNPYWEAPFAVTPTAEMKAEFRGYASLYREALGSSSAIYRFLCLYKIIEGVQARRRRMEREAKRQGTAFATIREVMPTTDEEISTWLDAIFPVRRKWDRMVLDSAVPSEARGKAFSEVVATILHLLRVNVAHALISKSGELTMSADELLHTQQVNKWLSATKCIARRMLKNEFSSEFLSYVRNDGSFVR
ncbi:MAG: methylamine utilization protein MauJ [Terriglobales bacterium]